MYIEMLDLDIADLSNIIFTHTKVLKEKKVKKKNIKCVKNFNIKEEKEVQLFIVQKTKIETQKIPIIEIPVIISKKAMLQERIKLKKIYEKKVRKLTKLQNLNSLSDSDKPRAYFGNFQSKDHYVIDHKISIWFGFKNNIPIEVIADISNLRWIPAFDNSRKNLNNFIDKDNQWIIDTHVVG